MTLNLADFGGLTSIELQDEFHDRPMADLIDALQTNAQHFLPPRPWKQRKEVIVDACIKAALHFARQQDRK
jgi:hypothetical protein